MIKFMTPFVILFLFASVTTFAVDGSERSDGNSKQWKAGAASLDITPELPMWMAGYGSRNRPGDEVALPIFAKALAIEDERGEAAVIITLDILGVPRILRKSVEQRVFELYDIAPSHLLMNASHTHSGPEIRAINTFLEQEDPGRTEQVNHYQEELEEMIIQVIDEALQAMVPARLAFGQSTAGFAMNRRQDYNLPEDDFRYGLRPNSEGPVDHSVPVLQITREDGSLLAVLFGYASHATTLGDYSFHGDYPGFAQYHLEQWNPDAVALFMAGCGGDQNPHPRRDMVGGVSGIELVNMHGQSLALAVEAALNAHPRPIESRLEAILEEVSLEYLPAPTRNELLREAESENRTVRENAQVLLEWLDRDGELPAHYPYMVQVMRFGNELTLVALASEVVVDYALRLKKELPGKGIWIAGYSNDFLGYIPSYRVWLEGGYEGGESMTFSSSTLYRGAAHPNIWAPTVEEMIISKVHELYGRIMGRNEVGTRK